MLVTTMGQGLLLLSRRRWRDRACGRCWEALRDCTRQDNVTRIISLETTRLRKIVLTTQMLRDSERSRSQTRLRCSERLRSQRRSCKAIIATARLRGLEKSCWRQRCGAHCCQHRHCHHHCCRRCHCWALPRQSQSPGLTLAEGLRTRFCKRETIWHKPHAGGQARHKICGIFHQLELFVF